jgi:hypothetical protein
VTYDKKNDVVSVYFDSDEVVEKNAINNSDIKYQEKSYEIDEAANLILDMIDLFDNKGNFTGFRVFDASRHYDKSLLSTADPEELSKEEILKKPDEKIITKFSEVNNKIYGQ